MASPLSQKMRTLADANHPQAIELNAKADEFDQACAECVDVDANEASSKSMLGAWARARRLYDECK